MKSIYIIILLLSVKMVQAHQPDLSNLMIYQQNDKYFLVIKSSLTAFEGEIDYLFGKNAYKTPSEFQLLVIKHFKNNCTVIINDDTVKLINPKVILGHETTLFAELIHTPNMYKSIYVKNTLFKDMPDNMCEIILTLKDITQKQYILDNSNNHEIKFKVENGNWIVVNALGFPFKYKNLFIGFFLSVITLIITIITIKKRKKVVLGCF